MAASLYCVRAHTKTVTQVCSVRQASDVDYNGRLIGRFGADAAIPCSSRAVTKCVTIGPAGLLYYESDPIENVCMALELSP